MTEEELVQHVRDWSGSESLAGSAEMTRRLLRSYDEATKATRAVVRLTWGLFTLTVVLTGVAFAQLFK